MVSTSSGPWEASVRNGVWAVSAALLVSAIMLGLVLAPYRMYKELWERNKALEEQNSPDPPRISISHGQWPKYVGPYFINARNEGGEAEFTGQMEVIESEGFESPFEKGALYLVNWESQLGDPFSPLVSGTSVKIGQGITERVLLSCFVQEGKNLGGLRIYCVDRSRKLSIDSCKHSIGMEASGLIAWATLKVTITASPQMEGGPRILVLTLWADGNVEELPVRS
jgi:hypothetical protein